MIAYLFVQDRFYSPSSVTLDKLSQMNWLPSKLSQLSLIEPQIQTNNKSQSDATQPILVHYLKYLPNHNETKFDAIYFNHGFGASSLSWLPSLTSITHKLNARLSLAHDATGFGLTQRPYVKDKSFKKDGKKPNIVQYTSAVSAAIGMSLLSSYSNITRFNEDNCISTEKSSSVVLFGHSMGCITTLRMALQLPQTMKKEIILVAPALFPTSNAPSASKASKNQNSFPTKLFPGYKFISLVKYLFIEVPFKYFLKRIVRYVFIMR